MKTNTTQINIFIASSGDTNKEREILKSYIEDWKGFYEYKNIILNPVMWEHNLATESGKTPQEAINDNLLSKCDFLIGIIGKKFGSPTKNYPSGTIEEIEFCIEKGKKVILYFLEQRIAISEINPKDIEQIQHFKEKYGKSNIYKEISDDSLEKKFRGILYKDLNKSIEDYLKDNAIPLKVTDTILTGSQLPWYKKSIKEFIEHKLEEHFKSPYKFYSEISFEENCRVWESLHDVSYSSLITIVNNFREEAYSIKYGDLNYNNNLRNLYVDWYAPIIKLLEAEGFTTDSTFKVIDVGANYGAELNEIFSDYPNAQLEAIDICKKAIERGKRTYNNIKFYVGNMEDSAPLKRSQYDVYLNLRSIHSTGVDIRTTLAQCLKILKSGGVAIFSISNGYVINDTIKPDQLIEKKGMYDERSETFSVHKPYELVSKLIRKLRDYGFKNIDILTGDTEIFIKGIK